MNQTLDWFQDVAGGQHPSEQMQGIECYNGLPIV